MTDQEAMRILGDALSAAYAAGYHDDPQEGPDVAELWAKLSAEILKELEEATSIIYTYGKELENERQLRHNAEDALLKYTLW